MGGAPTKKKGHGARTVSLKRENSLLVLFQLSGQVDVPAGDLDLALPRFISALLHRDHVLAVSERERRWRAACECSIDLDVSSSGSRGDSQLRSQFRCGHLNC